MWRKLKQRAQAGDTIVEVLIVLTVLSLAFSIAYATANKGLAQAQNAQEHSQALGRLDSQVELLRTAFANHLLGDPVTTTPFCLYYNPSDGNKLAVKQFSGFVPPDDRKADVVDNSESADPDVPSDKYPDECKSSDSQQLYHASIQYFPAGESAGKSYFRLTVRWEGLGSLGNQQEQFVYKIQALSSEQTQYPDPADPGPDLSPTVVIQRPPVDVAGPPKGKSFTWTIKNPLEGMSENGVTVKCYLDSVKIADPCTSRPLFVNTSTLSQGADHSFSVVVVNDRGYTGSDTYTWNIPPPRPAAPHIHGDDSGDVRIPDCYYAAFYRSFGIPAWDCGAWVRVTVYGVPGAVATVYSYNTYDGAAPSYSVALNGSGVGQVDVPVTVVTSSYTTNYFYIWSTQTVNGLTSNSSGQISGWSNADYGSSDGGISWYPLLWRSRMITSDAVAPLHQTIGLSNTQPVVAAATRRPLIASASN
jgi:type II secretory pathway pseudopilin PulG